MYQEIQVSSLVSRLCAKRNDLIKSNIEAISLMQGSIRICDEIDDLIPVAEDATIDTMSSVFHATKNGLGEYLATFPKIPTLRNASSEKILATVTTSVDRQLWMMLFNRLNIFCLMTGNARHQLYLSLQENVQEFCISNIESTLQDISQNRESMVMNSLMEIIRGADDSFASNSKTAFKKKTIFKNAIALVNRCYFKPQDNGPFRDLLKFLSYFVFANRPETNDGVIKRDYLFQLVSNAFHGYEVSDPSGIVVTFEGGEIRFFKNCCAHLILSEQMTSYLNDAASKTKALA